MQYDSTSFKSLVLILQKYSKIDKKDDESVKN